MAVNKVSHGADLTITVVTEVKEGKEIKKTQKFSKIKQSATADNLAAVATSIVELLNIQADTVPYIGKEEKSTLLQG